ncbi:MAG: hypothetical protein KGD70_02445 [Candidatus Lokiarchaeota archaeon]|jgi:hypothetical protein|nr:hypothetical protein [Candidatus Lokiarchaeota archaeon]
MSLTFAYFPFPPDIFTLLSIFIETFAIISLNVILLWSGIAEKEMRKENILISLSIINIAFILIRFAVPSVTGLPSTEAEIITFRIYVLLTGLRGRLPFFITYGLMMYWYGRVNRDSIGNKYRVSAWIFLVCNGFFVLNFTFAYIMTFTSTPYAFVDIQARIRQIFLFAYFVGWIFLSIHGISSKNVKFTIAGVLGGVMVFFMFLTYTIMIPPT